MAYNGLLAQLRAPGDSTTTVSIIIAATCLLSIGCVLALGETAATDPAHQSTS